MHELFNSPIIKQRNDNHLIGLINVVAYKRYGQTWAGDLLTRFENENSKPILTAGRLVSFLDSVLSVCSVIPERLESFRNYKGFRINFPKSLDAM